MEMVTVQVATKAQRRGMNYKTLSKREESIAQNCRCSTYRLLKMALKELYYNLSVSVYPACPVAPGDGTGVS
jgi:hypothetical protein